MLYTKTVQLIGETNKLVAVLRAFTRYACRLCQSSEINKLFRMGFNPSQREGIRALKEWIDYNATKNLLYRAVWKLSQYQRPNYKRTAQETGFDPDELRFLFRTLSPKDKQKIRAAPEPKTFESDEVLQVLHRVQPHIKRLVKQRLRYVWKNDGALSQEDFQGDLQCQAIKIIRNYEVAGLSVAKMVPVVAQSLTNHCTNLTIFYGKNRRNPLRQLQRENPIRHVWYCNVGAEVVERAAIRVAAKYRRGEYCLATFKNRPAAFVHVRRLYESRTEALAALAQYRAGQATTQRAVLVDLSAECKNDWQPTCTSLETPSRDGEDTVPIINFIPAEDDYDPTEKLLVDDLVQQTTDPRARMFFSAIRGDLGPLFDQFCKNTAGGSSRVLPPAALNRAARKYCGLTQRELDALISKTTT